jgi:hypothetical protein
VIRAIDSGGARRCARETKGCLRRQLFFVAAQAGLK